MSYAQFQDPDNFGFYESVTCAVRYDREKSYADFSDVEVQNYYGEKLFRKGERGVTFTEFDKLNESD